MSKAVNAADGAVGGAAAGSIAGPIGTAVGAIGGALVGALGSNASSYKQYKYNKALQSQAAKLNYDYSIKSAKNTPSAMRYGLESAGYNPMLAVQNSTSGANSNWTSNSSVSAPDYNSGITQGISNAQSFQRLANETMQAESASDANYANADKAKAEKAEITARLPFIPERQRKEIVKLEADTQFIEAQKHNLKERLDLDRQLGFAGIDANLYGSNVQREKNLIELEKTMRYNEWAKKHPWLASMSETAERHPTLLEYGRDYMKYKNRYDGDYDEYYGYTYDLKGRRDGYRKSRRKR